MLSSSSEGGDRLESLPPPPPVVPANVVPIKVELPMAAEPFKETSFPKRVPMARRDFGTKGQKLSLLTNHFKVSMHKTDGYFYHYSVCISFPPPFLFHLSFGNLSWYQSMSLLMRSNLVFALVNPTC